ncbi:MAG: hypothetical protein NTV01_05830 [Bacteroidia bacterium]|nr:hypothetical protein [Bacteroidia bacterium]
MFQLFMGTEPVDLSPDSTISMEEESPVFEKDIVPGGFSFPFDLPATPRNNRILGHPGRIQSFAQGGLNLPFQLFNNGKFIGAGTATVQKATDQAYSVFLQVATGDFAGKISGKKLTDVDFGGLRTWEFKPEYTYPQDDFALFPIYNPDFMNGTQYEAAWAANKCRLNSYEAGEWYNQVNSVMAISPYPYLAYVVNRVFNHFGFPVDENILSTDPDLKQLVIYNNHDSSQFTTTVTTHIRIIYDNRTGEWAPHEQIVKVSTITREFETWDLKDFLPDISISDFILAIRNMFNLAFTITSQGSVLIRKRKDLVVSGKAINLDSKTIGRPLVTIGAKVEGVYLRWVHEQNDLLFSEGFRDIYEDPKLLRPSVDTMDELEAIDATINEIRLITSYGQYYQYSREEVDEVTTYSWKFFSNDFQDFKIGESPEEFTAQASTLPMLHYQRLSGGPSIRCPQAKQLSGSIIRTTSLPCSLRLLFYRGMIDDSLGTPYPYGSSDAFDRVGDRLQNANLSLKWDGETGLYNQLWKDYLTWWNTRKVVTWTISDPSLLDFFTVYAIENNHYLLKKRSLSIQAGGPQPGECEFYLV